MGNCFIRISLKPSHSQTTQTDTTSDGQHRTHSPVVTFAHPPHTGITDTTGGRSNQHGDQEISHYDYQCPYLFPPVGLFQSLPYGMTFSSQNLFDGGQQYPTPMGDICGLNSSRVHSPDQCKSDATSLNHSLITASDSFKSPLRTVNELDKPKFTRSSMKNPKESPSVQENITNSEFWKRAGLYQVNDKLESHTPVSPPQGQECDTDVSSQILSCNGDGGGGRTSKTRTQFSITGLHPNCSTLTREPFKHSTSHLVETLPSTNSKSITTTHDVHYTFYVKDNSEHRRLFEDNRVQALAAGIGCLLFYYKRRSEKETPIYHRGSAVRPVTLKAKDIATLKKCLNTIDTRFPQLNCKSFLPTQT